MFKIYAESLYHIYKDENQLSYLHESQIQYNNAIKYLNNINDNDLLLKTAFINYEFGDNNNAIGILNNIIKKSSDYNKINECNFLLGCIYVRKNENKKAIKKFEEVIPHPIDKYYYYYYLEYLLLYYI